jgi:hypothetical protein
MSLPSHLRELVGSPSSCMASVQAATGGRGEARAGKEKDTNKILTSPTFHFANSRWWRRQDLLGQWLGFGEEERTKVGK